MARIRYDHDNKTWLHLRKGDPKSDNDIYLSDIRLKYLDQVKKDLQDDKDHVQIICGAVGSGKSTLGRLDCRYVSDERFHPRTHSIRSVEDVKPVITSAKKGDAILIDEGSGIFSATDTMTKKTKYAQYVLDVCRQKNLMIVIACPNFHRLTSGVAVDRSITLSRTYFDSRTGARGRYAFYGTKLKEKLYRYSKANYGSMKAIKPKYRGRFGNDKTFKEEYRKVKDETLNIALSSLEGKDKAPTPQETIQSHSLRIVRNNMDMNIEQMASLLDVSERTISRLRADVKREENAKIEEMRIEKLLNSSPSATLT